MGLTIEIQKDYFDTLSVDEVGHACFEPMVRVYQDGMRRRNGQNAQEYRTEFYKTLTQGQRALFGFFSFFDHAIRSKEEFKHIAGHYLSGQIFSIVKAGAEYFEAVSMQSVLWEIEQAYSGPKDIQNSRMDELYNHFCGIAPDSLKQIGVFIKENPTEFVSFI